MAQDLDFFFKKISFTMAQDLDFFSKINFFHYGSGLRFFFQKISFTMAQDLDFFSKKFLPLWLRT